MSQKPDDVAVPDAAVVEIAQQMLAEYRKAAGLEPCTWSGLFEVEKWGWLAAATVARTAARAGEDEYARGLEAALKACEANYVDDPEDDVEDERVNTVNDCISDIRALIDAARAEVQP